MESKYQVVFAQWLCWLCILTVPTMGCRDEERRALIRFSRSLVDPDNWLSSSWIGADCCTWQGVGCSNTTGHVLKLDLRNRFYAGERHARLRGHIDSSLLELKHLRHLDLSYNNFPGELPYFIGFLTSLRYLNLSNSGFSGAIPTELGNLSELQFLDLGSSPSLYAQSLQWLTNIPYLQYIDMKSVDLSYATDWQLVLHSFPSLSVLMLSSCRLGTLLPSINNSPNITSLTTLDLSSNNIFSSTIPDWIFNMRNLTYLNLYGCYIRGPIPKAIRKLSSLRVLNLANNLLEGSVPTAVGDLCSLETLDIHSNIIVEPLAFSGCIQDSLQTLDLSKNRIGGYLPEWMGRIKNLRTLRLYTNNLSGPIPASFGNLSSLRELHLNMNNLSGHISSSLGQLSELIVLDLRSNNFEGVLSEAHFANLTKLEALFLSPNYLTLNLSSTWVPPFQLKNIRLGSCQMGPSFPSWLRTQTEFSTLDISNAGISDRVPNWFWNQSSQLYYLNISCNQMSGELPNPLDFLTASIIDMSSNRFTGKLPRMNSSVESLYLYDNAFSGELRPILNMEMLSLSTVLLSGNLLAGQIPFSLCELKGLFFIDLSDNFLSGEIPKWLTVSRTLSYLNFANNSLLGPIPDWIGSLLFIRSLHLSNNMLHGEIPLSLRNCTQLVILDIGQNKLTGSIPKWIGERLSRLVILRLRSNMFTGSIPPELSYLASLQILDLANNHLSGRIPCSFKNLTSMIKGGERIRFIVHSVAFTFVDYDGLDLNTMYKVSLSVVIKGREFEYSKTLSLVVSMDLSDNVLSGEIPEGLVDLVALHTLNLSGNYLSGRIPYQIGDMVTLETLDLSRNRLTGRIPSTITSLTLLSSMNLSSNNLSGKIPSGNQLQTLTDPSIYQGNIGLCGFPLSIKCHGKEPIQSHIPCNWCEASTSGIELAGFYFSLGIGFAFGFWGICVCLLNKSWRDAHFRHIDELEDIVYGVTISVSNYISHQDTC